MTQQDALFVSHGSPMLALQDGPAHQFLKGMERKLDGVTGILVASAHWETAEIQISTAEYPETIHDFSGFPRALYELRYPAPGAPALARRAQQALSEGGVSAALHPSRGLDHGAWVPLSLMRPAADIPVAQISIQPHRTPAHHLAVGAALATLRAEGVLILASGSITHNLREFRGQETDAPATPWAERFAEWVAEKAEAGDLDALVNFEAEAPEAARNHPSTEHFLPLFVALGAGAKGGVIKRLHKSFTHGILSMDAYQAH
jgi:4,5-DOPA dioxygenase extradiol